MIVPPPTPKRPLKTPAAVPIATSCSVRSGGTAGDTTAAMAASEEQKLAHLLEPLRAAPKRSAVLCDLDGTLAPIVERPEEATVPQAAVQALRALARHYALCAVITGRRALQAKAMLGLDELAYCGNHGFELLPPGEAEPSPSPALHGRERDAARFVEARGADALSESGVRVEDKGAIVALHWRGAADEDGAQAAAERVARAAESDGLLAHRGRKVIEIRPRVAIDKGLAVRSLLADRGLAAALYGGDDRTDLDAFAALRALRDEGTLATACCVAVASAEAPPGLVPEADLVVEGTEGFLQVLALLAR